MTQDIQRKLNNSTSTESVPDSGHEGHAEDGKHEAAMHSAGHGRDVKTSGDAVPLLGQADVSSFNDRWSDVQTRFVDEPRDSVKQADELVAEVIQKLATRFADERGRLEQRWQSGTDASTEDLRQALQLYRSFFQRLLAA